MSRDKTKGCRDPFRPLGYDLRLVGARADQFRAERGLHWRPHLLAASYDTNVCPGMFVPPDTPAERFQTALDPRQASASFFIAFQLFRSTLEAISFIPDRALARDFELWRFTLIRPQNPPGGVFAGILDAMRGEAVAQSGLPVERLGHEVLDSDGASVTHTHYGPDLPPIDTARLGEEADRLADMGHWLMAIDRVTHPWWLPQ